MGNAATVLQEHKKEVKATEVVKKNYVDRHMGHLNSTEWETYLRNYARRMHKSRKCMQCFGDFKTAASLLNHIANDHNPTVSHSTTSARCNSTPICTECRRTFATVKALQQHAEECNVNYWQGPDVGKKAGQKRAKLRKPANEVPKKQKVELPGKDRKSVKTINSGSCIRQFSRPNVPPKGGRPVGRPPNGLTNTGKQASKPKPVSVLKAPRVRPPSIHALGLVDFDKIRTTARTRAFKTGSLPDLRGLGSSLGRSSSPLVPTETKKEVVRAVKTENCAKPGLVQNGRGGEEIKGGGGIGEQVKGEGGGGPGKEVKGREGECGGEGGRGGGEVKGREEAGVGKGGEGKGGGGGEAKCEVAERKVNENVEINNIGSTKGMPVVGVKNGEQETGLKGVYLVKVVPIVPQQQPSAVQKILRPVSGPAVIGPISGGVVAAPPAPPPPPPPQALPKVAQPVLVLKLTEKNPATSNTDPVPATVFTPSKAVRTYGQATTGSAGAGSLHPKKRRSCEEEFDEVK